MRTIRLLAAALLVGAFVMGAAQAADKKKYGPGVSDTEIKLGQTVAYSGPAGVFAPIAKAEAAYFKMINDQGGINGRKIEMISLDDAFSGPKALELTRQLVEQEKVLAIVGTLGWPSNGAIRDYLNATKVPHILLGVATSEWGDPARYPWTMGFQPTFAVETRIYARYILQTMPDAKIAVLYRNDAFGRDYLEGLTTGLGARATAMIVKIATYELGATNVDAQMEALQASGANVFINTTSGGLAVQTMRKARDSGWKPTQFLVTQSNHPQLMKMAGRGATDVISAAYLKDPTDKTWADDRGRQDWDKWMRLYNRSGNLADQINVYGYLVAMTLVQVLQQCGDDLTRENVMKQAANLKGLALPMLLPGITINTSASDYFPIQQMQLQKFDGDNWVLFGGVIDG